MNLLVRRGVIAALPLLVSLAANAADNRFNPRIEVGGIYNSNLRLLADPIDNEVQGGYADITGAFESSTQRTTLRLIPRIRATQYTKNQQDEATDVFLNGSLEHRAERSSYGFDLFAADQNVVTSEFLRPGDGNLGQPGTGDAGIVQVRNDVMQIYASPRATFITGERSDIRISGTWSDIDYDRNVSGGQVDYRNLQGSLAWSYQANERIRVTTAADFTRFDPAAGGLASDGKGLRVEAWREQTERTRAFVRVGAMRNTTDGVLPGTERDSTSALLGVGLQRRLERGALLLQANRSVDANGTGQLLNRTEGYVEWSHRLTPRTTLNFGGRSVWSSAVEDNSGFVDQNYYVLSAAAEWRLTQAVSLLGRYERSNQSFEGSTSNNSNAVRVGIVYAPNRLATE